MHHFSTLYSILALQQANHNNTVIEAALKHTNYQVHRRSTGTDPVIKPIILYSRWII